MAKPISVVDPITPAFTWMKRVLFQPFDISKWFVLGFCVWLAELLKGGMGSSFQFPGGPGGGPGSGGGPAIPPEAKAWFQENLGWIVLAGVGLLLLVLGIKILCLWLNSRADFLFLDNVIRNRAEIVKPWRQFRRLGNSLFSFRLVLILAAFVATLLILGLCVLIAWPDIDAGRFTAYGATALGVLVLLLLPLSLVLVAIGLVLHDFVLPIMYYRDATTLDAFRTFRAEIVPGHVGVLILFYLMKLALGFVGGMIAMAALVVLMICTLCLFCCVMALPLAGTYLMAVLYLPISVFFRSYPLFFLAQFGDRWRMMNAEGDGGDGVDGDAGAPGSGTPPNRPAGPPEEPDAPDVGHYDRGP